MEKENTQNIKTPVNEKTKVLKKLKDLTIEEIKSLGKFSSTFYKTESRDRSRQYYSVKVHLKDGFFDKGIDLTQTEYFLEATAMKQDLTLNQPFDAACYIRFTKGINRLGNEFHLVGIIFNERLRKSFLLSDDDVKLLKVINLYDELKWEIKDGEIGEELMSPFDYDVR